jgi:hypothetical protein
MPFDQILWESESYAWIKFPTELAKLMFWAPAASVLHVQEVKAHLRRRQSLLLGLVQL